MKVNRNVRVIVVKSTEYGDTVEMCAVVTPLRLVAAAKIANDIVQDGYAFGGVDDSAAVFVADSECEHFYQAIDWPALLPRLQAAVMIESGAHVSANWGSEVAK